MLKVVVGSLVLCHLLPVTAPDSTSGRTQNVIKVLGEVVEINQTDHIEEKIEERLAIRSKRDLLTVKGINHEGLYQINANACMIVKDEKEIVLKKVGPAVSQEPENIEIKKSDPVKEAPPVPEVKPAMSAEPEGLRPPAEVDESKTPGQKVNRSLVDFLK